MTFTHEQLPPVKPAAGARIGGCTLIRELGRGGMGVVHLARQERLQRDVALKVVEPSVAKDPDFRRRFALEAKHAAAVRDSHVVPVFDSGEDSGQLYVTSAYI